MARDWAAVRESKEAALAERLDRLGPAESLRMADARSLLAELEEALGQSDLVPELERLLAREERSPGVRGRTAPTEE